MTDSSPPHKSESGKDIKYAAGLLPNGGGLAPPVIGFHAPKTSSLLQGQLREPTDTGKKRKTKTSAIDPSAAKKKPRKQKAKPADDLPDIDPDTEEVLAEEEIEVAVDEAAAELSDVGEQTPSTDIPAPQKTPPTPIAPVWQTRVRTLVQICCKLNFHKPISLLTLGYCRKSLLEGRNQHQHQLQFHHLFNR